jgi:hypothetical protein
MIKCSTCGVVADVPSPSTVHRYDYHHPWPAWYRLTERQCASCGCANFQCETSFAREVFHWSESPSDLMEFSILWGHNCNDRSPYAVFWIWTPLGSSGLVTMDRVNQCIQQVKDASGCQCLLVLPPNSPRGLPRGFDGGIQLRREHVVSSQGPFPCIRAERLVDRISRSHLRTQVVHFWPSVSFDSSHYIPLDDRFTAREVFSMYSRNMVGLHVPQGEVA